MATTKQTGFDVDCPKCGEACVITLDLTDLDVITCVECEESFDAESVASDLRNQAAQWKAVAEWIKAAGIFIERATANKETGES